MADNCSDPYGTLLSSRCTEECILLFGLGEFQKGAIVNYWGDFLIRVGPIMYIVRIKSIGLPGPYTGDIDVLGAMWTQELETECKRLGSLAERTIPTEIFFQPLPVQAIYPPALQRQTKLSATFTDKFSYSWHKRPRPRWVYTQFWGEK